MDARLAPAKVHRDKKLPPAAGGSLLSLLILDPQGKINDFHNVCRHRAYPLVEEDAGSVNILACKYHGRPPCIRCEFSVDVIGWSSGINGKLANAPRYQELDGFDKEKSGLFPIHVQIDKLGFI
jgi:phenylpropionate dioxygenase-like ring-hydroxylating dioxygenase large terminal subunit